MLAGSYIANVNIRQSATTASGTWVWALVNPLVSTRSLYVQRISLDLFFDGIAVAGNSRYEIAKLTGITATSGGIAIVPILKSTASGPPQATPLVKDTGIALTGGVVQGLLVQCGACRVPPTAAVPPVRGMLETQHWTSMVPPIQLVPGEALGIRLAAAAVIGDNIVGWAEWDEL